MCHNGAHASGVEMSTTHSADRGRVRSTLTRIMRFSGGLRRLTAQGSRPSTWLRLTAQASLPHPAANSAVSDGVQFLHAWEILTAFTVPEWVWDACARDGLRARSRASRRQPPGALSREPRPEPPWAVRSRARPEAASTNPRAAASRIGRAGNCRSGELRLTRGLLTEPRALRRLHGSFRLSPSHVLHGMPRPASPRRPPP